MALYISFDGGGTKLNGILFDEQMRLLGSGRSGGINRTQATQADCLNNIRACMDEMLSAHPAAQVDVMYYTGVGDFDLLRQHAGERLRIGRYQPISEPVGGLLSGALKTEGLLALAGTGSDVFYITPEKNVAVGGWGPILGDDGSGAWIGQQAIRAVVRYLSGWGESTVLLPMITEHWHMKDPWDMVRIVHGSAAPFRQVAGLTPLVGKAAGQGDQVSLKILREAGRLMAQQMESLIRQENISDPLDVTLCGGAWKAHPVMLDQFCTDMLSNHPGFQAHRPIFEHVIAGPAMALISEKRMPREEALSLLTGSFPQYLVQDAGN